MRARKVSTTSLATGDKLSEIVVDGNELGSWLVCSDPKDWVMRTIRLEGWIREVADLCPQVIAKAIANAAGRRPSAFRAASSVGVGEMGSGSTRGPTRTSWAQGVLV